MNVNKILYIEIIIIIILIVYIYCFSLQEEFISSKKKIAFCFLIYDEIDHEELWNTFFKNVDKSKYNIYIHYKDNKPLKYFENYKLNNCIETCWGCISVVLAQNLILKTGLEDKQNSNFIWLSGSCIPLKSFDYMYNHLDSHKSYFNICPDSQVSSRLINDDIYKYVKQVKKAAMPSIINRKHATLFIKNEDNIKLWFKHIRNVDEIVYITLLYYYNLENELVLTPNLAADSKIYAGWRDISNYKDFPNSIKEGEPDNYTFICKEELDYLLNSKSLFARKFKKEAYNSIIDNNNYIKTITNI